MAYHWLKSVGRRATGPLVSAVVDSVRERMLTQYAVYGPAERLHLASTAIVNDALFNLSSGEIFVGEWAMLAHGVAVFTGTHDVTKFGKQRQEARPRAGRDVHIGEGAWLASRVTVLGPCRIGEHAVVAAGSVVTKDVDPYTVVAGNPARFLKVIPHL
ncbi:MAG TPA: acyltransferase [Chloroflexota bacterium]|nr:acyltransferase [Chloroflexota bacterium]